MAVAGYEGETLVSFVGGKSFADRGAINISDKAANISEEVYSHFSKYRLYLRRCSSMPKV